MNSGPSIRSGSAGSDVRRLQRLLVEMKILSFERIDGNFGSATVRDGQLLDSTPPEIKRRAGYGH